MKKKNIALSLYYDMLKIRMVEERIAELYPEQEMRCPVHLCIGQEAIAAGVCADLSSEDYCMSNHRSHGHYLAKGGDLKAMMAEIYGKETGCSKGRGGSMHLIDLSAGFLGATPIVGSTISIATGAAFASSMCGDRRVTVVFFGDAATEEGVFHESLNFAVLKNLPILFVCENNLYSVNSPLSVRQPKGREIFKLAQAHGIESLNGDGNDALGVYALASEAIEKARRGEGPTFLEFATYRWREHCGPDYDHESGCRPKNEFEGWMKRCPIDNLKRRLLEDGMLSESAADEMTNRLRTEIDEAVSFAKESPFPEESSASEGVYA